MASGKEIKGQIRAIQNTQKITKAMEMVAASKMRRAQDRMEQARPYAQKMRRVMAHLSHAEPEYKHPFMIEREPQRVGYVVVSSDRGLCGALNINVFRKVLADMRDWDGKGVKARTAVIGSKAAGFFKRLRAEVVAEVTDLGDTPHIDRLIGTVKVLLDAYREGEVDRVYLVHNEFVNTMTQRPAIRQLLPVVADEEQASEHLLETWDYIYEPDPIELLDGILTRYVEAQVYHGVAENAACEMAARMIAMKNASDNAGNIIDDLQLAYNKARQASITQELSEIVSGAAAV